LGSINRKWLRRGVRYARTPAGGGLIVALVGSDGSGKSTMGSSVYRWLAGKVDVMPIYFGSGKGASSLLRWPLHQARRLVKRRGHPAVRGVGPDRKAPGLDRVVWALVLAREKRIKLRRAARARGKGLIVVCDRYPQTQTPGMIDGPLLSAWLTSDDAGRRRLARWETASYALAGEVGPDLVLRLEVSKETARSRRPDVDPDTLDMRQEVVAGLEYPEARFGLQSIDGERDLDSVLLDVKESVWNVL
jgi:thymidylate kinase